MGADAGILERAGEQIAAMATRFGPAVVGVGRGWRVGSGFVVSAGRVLTAARHVEREGTTVTFADGERSRADLSAIDRDRGLAVLAVDTGETPALAFAEDFEGSI